MLIAWLVVMQPPDVCASHAATITAPHACGNLLKRRFLIGHCCRYDVAGNLWKRAM
jgi:hypothetical protein